MTLETLSLLAYHFLINYTNINFNFIWIWITIMKSKLIIYSSHQSVVWLQRSGASQPPLTSDPSPPQPLTTPTVPPNPGSWHRSHSGPSIPETPEWSPDSAYSRLPKWLQYAIKGEDNSLDTHITQGLSQALLRPRSEGHLNRNHLQCVPKMKVPESHFELPPQNL